MVIVTAVSGPEPHVLHTRFYRFGLRAKGRTPGAGLDAGLDEEVLDICTQTPCVRSGSCRFCNKFTVPDKEFVESANGLIVDF